MLLLDSILAKASLVFPCWKYSSPRWLPFVSEQRNRASGAIKGWILPRARPSLPFLKAASLLEAKWKPFYGMGKDLVCRGKNVDLFIVLDFLHAAEGISENAARWWWIQIGNSWRYEKCYFKNSWISVIHAKTIAESWLILILSASVMCDMNIGK